MDALLSGHDISISCTCFFFSVLFIFSFGDEPFFLQKFIFVVVGVVAQLVARRLGFLVVDGFRHLE